MPRPDSDFLPEGSDPPTGSTGITNITNANPGVITASGPLDFGVGDDVWISGVGGMTQINERKLTATSITGSGPYSIVVNDAGTDVDTTAYGAYTGGGTIQKYADGGVSSTGVATCYNNLFDTGAYNTITWGGVADAQRYYIYKLENGLWGFIGQTTTLTFKDDNIAPDLSKTPPIQHDPFASAGNYPGACGYFEQRRCFAGTVNEPAYFWATRSGTEKNLSYSIPSRDDDSILFRIAARERCEIRHIVPLANLVLLAESSEWRVTPASGEVLTPDVSVRSQSAIGSSIAAPIIANNNIVFPAARGGHVRELGFDNDAGGYVTGDLCLRAPHLFDELEIVDMAYQKSPIPTVWAVSSNGWLLGLTYVPEQEVGAWHRHDTIDGFFESICVVPEGTADVLYAVVRRETALGTERFIERLEPRQSTDDAADFFVDSGLSYDGTATTTFSGLDHLEGKTVSILADGGVVPPQEVASGQITLENAASVVHVGLPITADVKTLPVAFEVAGYGQGRPKNVNRVWLRVFETRDIRAGPTFDTLREHKPRTTEPYDSAPDLITAEVAIEMTPTWAANGEICLRHDQPLPITLLSITPEFSVGG